MSTFLRTSSNEIKSQYPPNLVNTAKQFPFIHKENILKNKLSRPFAVALLCSASLSAFADNNFDQLGKLSQTEFGLLARDLTAAGSYKAVSPGEPLGTTGFDIGAEVSVTQLGYENVWRKAGEDISSVVLPKIHFHKGLPYDIDIGASLAAVPNSDIKVVGFEASYAILGGNTLIPSLSLRAATTRMSGVSQLDLKTESLELTLSKGFLLFTPYAGVGRVWGSVTPHAAQLAKVSTSANKIFVGFNANLGLINLLTEVDRTGDNDTVSVKVGFRW
jgi:hypothetical protein